MTKEDLEKRFEEEYEDRRDRQHLESIFPDMSKTKKEKLLRESKKFRKWNWVGRFYSSLGGYYEKIDGHKVFVPDNDFPRPDKVNNK